VRNSQFDDEIERLRTPGDTTTARAPVSNVRRPDLRRLNKQPMTLNGLSNI